MLLTRCNEVHSPTPDAPVTVMEKPSDYKNNPERKPDSLLKRIPLYRLTVSYVIHGRGYVYSLQYHPSVVYKVQKKSSYE